MSRAVWTAAVCSLAVLPAYPQTPAEFSLLKSCGDGATSIATLRASDPVAIRYSFAAGSGTCFAVTATVDGKPVDGYLLGNAHPAIKAFEHEVQQAKVIPPPPPPAPPAPAEAVKPAPAEPPKPTPLSFAGFRATDVKGDRVDLSRSRAPNVVIYFWSAGTRAGRNAAEPVEALFNNFHSRGVDIVGVASGVGRAKLQAICDEDELNWPQILDGGGIAERYHVDPQKPFLLLDQSRNVIAAVPSAGALTPILQDLTKYRRPRL